MDFFIQSALAQSGQAANEVKNLAVGDEVVTNGGVLGKITAVDEYFFKVKIAADTEVKIQKIAIAQVMPSSTVE